MNSRSMFDPCMARMLVCLFACGSVHAEEDSGQWISLPTVGYVCVMPKSYEMPYTQRGIQGRIAAGRYLHRNNSERGVFLHDDQVFGLSCVKSGDLEFLKHVPDSKLHALTLLAPWISDEGIIVLKRCKNLRHLALHLDRVDNMDEVLTASPRLQYFAFSSPLNLDPATAKDEYFFRDRQFRCFEKLSDLRCIHVNSRLLSDEAIRSAVKLPKLEVLGIRGTRKITDEGFTAIAAAKNLKEVVVEAGPRCTDAGIMQLLKLEHLEWIEIYGMSSVDDSTRDALKARFPNAEIRFKPLLGP